MKPAIVLLSACLLSINSVAQLPGSGTALNFDGSNDFVDANSTALEQIANNFTFEFWYNASNNITIKSEQNGLGDISGTTGQRYLIFPSFGGSPSGIAARAGAGVSVGLNAIQVFELRDSYMPALLSYSGSLIQSGWNHVAIVYTAKQPSLYLNGELARTGLTSQQDTVYASCLIAGGPFGRYEGDLDELRIWSTSRTPTEIRNFMCSKLSGTESGLIRYYRFDDGSGTTLEDETGNQNGTLTNMDPATDWITSAASLGDSSAHSYSISTSTSLNMPGTNGDNLTAHVTSQTVAPRCIHVYRVDQSPNITLAPGTQQQLSQIVYYGVKVVGGSGLSYTLAYEYDGHLGIANENFLELAKRDDNADGTWSQESATLNTISNTLTLSNQSGAEYILASLNTNPLPIELLSFQVYKKTHLVEITWKSATEVNNSHYTVERSPDGFHWKELARIKGAGNSSTPLHYTTSDTAPFLPISYYRLKQTDFNGAFQYSEVRSLQGLEAMPSEFAVYPNPTSSFISLQGSGISLQHLHLFNSLGQDITTCVQPILLNNTHMLINLSTLPAGSYCVKLGQAVQHISKL